MHEVPKNKNLIIFLASIGHALELYDYLLFGVMIPFLVPVLFPAEDFATSIIFGYISFAVAFMFAPLGSIIWGWLGDKYGRQKLLRYSIFFMALPALGIACLPTYQNVGILAPILLILLRVLQGISASGEVMGSKIFAMEHLGEKYYGLVSGVISAAGGVGLLLAMFTGYLAVQFKEYPDFWRVPFLVGFCIYFVGVMIRRYLSETLPFLHIKNTDIRSPFFIFTIIVRYFKTSLLVFALGGMVGVMSYTLNTFLNPYMIAHGVPQTEVYVMSIIGIVGTIFGALIAGALSDKSRNFWPFLILTVLTFAALQPFLFAAIFARSGGLILTAIIVYGFLLGSFATFSSIAMYKAFPTHFRCRGVLFNYSLGVGLCGGPAPVILQLLDASNHNFPMIALTTFSVAVALICCKGKKWENLSLVPEKV